MRKIQLTEMQVWFIKKAIELQDAVLPLAEETMTDEEFKKDYGVTKKQVRKSLESLYNKIK